MYVFMERAVQGTEYEGDYIVGEGWVNMENVSSIDIEHKKKLDIIKFRAADIYTTSICVLPEGTASKCVKKLMYQLHIKRENGCYLTIDSKGEIQINFTC